MFIRLKNVCDIVPFYSAISTRAFALYIFPFPFACRNVYKRNKKVRLIAGGGFHRKKCLPAKRKTV